MRLSKICFHPVFVLASAALGVLLYFAFMRWRIPNGNLTNHFIYTLPIIVPFVSFLFDRGEHFRRTAGTELMIDFLVVAVSILRGLGAVPLVSGHVLFLTYALARPGSRLTKMTAFLVILQVFYLKIFVWHDPVSPAIGIMLGMLAAFLVRRLSLPMVTSFSHGK